MFISRQFSIVCFDRQIIDATLLRPLISTDPLLSYINCCTTHYSSVLFWIQFCLDQIKVITRAHPCHHFHRDSNLQPWVGCNSAGMKLKVCKRGGIGSDVQVVIRRNYDCDTYVPIYIQYVGVRVGSICRYVGVATCRANMYCRELLNR
jgi:hypothetical protein